MHSSVCLYHHQATHPYFFLLVIVYAVLTTLADGRPRVDEVSPLESQPLATLTLDHQALRTPPVDRTERHLLSTS